MEKYKVVSNDTNSINVNFGRYFDLVHRKHIESYGEIGADNIVSNIVETYKQIQVQMLNPKVSNNVLLVGKVQSGKTSNLELLTALAFDNGYNILVIYGGYDTSLLKQTTERFMDTFDASGEITYDGDAPAVFTTDDSAQILSIDDEIMTDLLENNKPVIFVSMKRPAAMKKINTLFKRLDKSEFKAFIIDDEGDQASLNTAKDKINNSSATYKQIQEMKKQLSNPMYLSVTATPQANIFLNQWSALRPDSIRLIQPGIGYQGAEAYHIVESNIVEFVSDEDHDDLVNGTMPDSLWLAIRYFIVASAAKRKLSSSSKEKYSDMIIHAFREVSQHSNIYTSVESYIKTIREAFEYDDYDEVAFYMNEFKQCYDDHFDNYVKNQMKFEDLYDELRTVIKKVKVILKNGIGKTTQGNENLKWHKIYIGGDLLQRGLTFKNLITTYFTRWATGGGNMDTNLQRARWFGYRQKYIHLCKIFTTPTIAQEFTALAEIEDDLWDQFAEVENGSLKIDDILIQSDKTKQNPTSKARVSYNKVSFKNRWIKQRVLVEDQSQIDANNHLVDKMIDSCVWQETTVGSRINQETAQYTTLSSEHLKKLINLIQSVFDYEPFQKKALIDLLGQDNLPVILMWKHDDTEETKKRYRSMYPNTYRIKALQQGADSSLDDKITYEGDSSVVVDREKINIQIHCITPGYKGKQELRNKSQYMFAVYLPKEKVYFVKGD